MDNIRYLTAIEVIAINVAVIQKYSAGEQIGVKSSSLLESAVMCPRASAFGDDAYPTVFHKAAALFESLGQNHPFHNANKRTAFTSLVLFFRFNGYHFVMNQKSAEDMTVDMVNRKLSFHQLVALLQQHCTAIIEKP